MNDIEKGVLLLLKSAITGEAYQLPEHFNLEQAISLIRRHGVLSMGYVGALHCGFNKKDPAVKELFRAYCTNTLTSERQMRAVQKLYAAFDQHCIDYMPVKGCNMKSLYPEPVMRNMGDADILIKLEQYDKIRPIMQELGYEELVESDHELDWRSSVLMVELHKRLIPSYNQDYYRYYGDGWRLASSSQGTHYFMTPEDEFIYIFTHLAKHYRDGGIGCRHVLEIWVYLRKFPQMDMAYVHQELEKLELLEFYQNICQVIHYWFDGQPADEKTEFISKFLLNSGNWGSKNMHIISNGVRQSVGEKSIQRGRIKQFIRLLFPPAYALRARYPSLEQHAGALPFFWVRRWVEAALFRRKNVASALNNMKTASSEKILEYEQALDYVGLHFRFEE